MDLGVWKPSGLIEAHRCWQCGTLPEDLVEIHSMAGPVRLEPLWPAGDHVHADRPPTPEELLEAAERSLRRIREGG